MIRDTSPTTARRFGLSPNYNRRGAVPANFRSVRQPYRQFTHRPDRPPGSPAPPVPVHHDRPNFIVELRSTNTEATTRQDVLDLISKFKLKAEEVGIYDRGALNARLCFQQWTDALEATVHFWETCLNASSLLVPRLIRNLVLPSDTDELGNRLKTIFTEHVEGLFEGELVRKWQEKLSHVMEEIEAITALLRKPKRVTVHDELCMQRRGLIAERDLIGRRIREFKTGMECVLCYLEGKECGEEEGVRVLLLKGDFDWGRIYWLVRRECRRLDDGLPIYAFRQDILWQIHCQQIMVLIGETGSGKSTQLVQFLADSGVAGHDTIICTQPRKLAAISLAQRVKEESCGCYHDNSVTCCPVYSSVQQCDTKVIYMTDHCLLQHYMNDKKLSRVSCIIVDEAHERSLNTDLLLALIKKLLHQRVDLRLVIMSATADANQLAEYFFGCGTFTVVGRNFPVDIRYVPCASEVNPGTCTVASYVYDVVRMVNEIHRTEKEGTVLAFLTSQMEVEWACEKFQAPYAVALPLHGKLSHDDQLRAFANHPGKRKVIFATNLAETSLTIPGVKYVVDSGMVKESKFEPGSGMNVLRVSRISQSSAHQRAGRAGRTEPGRCYRLYSEQDLELMPLHQEPEIRRVHLGVAVLRIFALGMKDVKGFDFVDAPSGKAIEMAIRNLTQLGAVEQKNDVYELTKEGNDLARLGIEPRLGKMVLKCCDHGLGKEGVVLAALLANSSSVFCRVGTEEDKRKSDRLKVQFCHRNGDLFTLLSVFREWELVHPNKKKQWCWDHSINAKSMRRCQDTVNELDTCLQNEVHKIVPSYWVWNPLHTQHETTLKHIILSSLAENAAMYSGYDELGYEVAMTGKHVQLHPSCSLLAFSQRPSWVVFSEILSTSNQYLVCVSAIDVESLPTLCPPPLFDVIEMDNRKLEMKALTGFGSMLLKKLCGKSNNGLLHLVTRIRIACNDDRIGVEVDVVHNKILLFASSKDIEKACTFVGDVVEYESKLLRNECLEKGLYLGGRGVSPAVALFGAGAEIKHLELENRCLTVDVFHSGAKAVDEKDFLMFLDRNTSGSICAVHKFAGIGQDNEDKPKWGSITFLTPDAAKEATKLNGVEFMGSSLKVVPSRGTYGGDHKIFSFPAVKAKVYWPRRYSKGFAIVKCEQKDVPGMVDDFSNMFIGGKFVRCEAGMREADSVVIAGLDRELSEAEILGELRTLTNRKILDVFLVRGDSVENLSCDSCEKALLREVSPFMPKSPDGNSVYIQVFPPQPKDTYMRALIAFNGSLHLEAAKALEQIEGKVLPGCLSWQKIKCQQLFHSFVSCPSPVYSVIKKQLDSLLSRLRHRKGAECSLHRNENGSYRVKISANATKTVAELRGPLEKLMRGKTIDHADLTPTVLQFLFSRDGCILMKSIQKDTGTYILFDRQSLNVRIFGSPDKIAMAEQRLVQSLLTIYESKQLEVHLRGGVLPPDLMKRVVEKFGPELHGLKEKVPAAEFTLNTRRHVISMHGSKHLKQQVEDLIYDIAQTSGPPMQRIENKSDCPICLCEMEEGYKLESCAHEFCRSCLVEQCESAIKSQDSFPIRCTHVGCGALILLTDLRSLLSNDKLEELFRASVGAFVATSRGSYRFCPSPDCPAVYQVADSGSAGRPFFCGACYVETCTRCHLEYHPYLLCEKYREFKEDPDSSLKEWSKGKEHVKNCPVCGFTIEKVDGCNHVECRCGKHICWVCVEFFGSSEDCYGHLRSVHLAII